MTLPRHLDWSGHTEYDLNRTARLASVYKVVPTEASTAEDLNIWLDAELLRRLWGAVAVVDAMVVVDPVSLSPSTVRKIVRMQRRCTDER